MKHVSHYLIGAAIGIFAIGTSGCASINDIRSTSYKTGAQTRTAMQTEFGHIIDFREVDAIPDGKTGAGLGAVVGGVAGYALAGSAGGAGRALATIAGLAGGAVAGEQIERAGEQKAYEITVKTCNGNLITVVQGLDWTPREGIAVKIIRHNREVRIAPLASKE